MSSRFDSALLFRSFLGVAGLYILGVPLLLLANIVLARTLSVGDFGAFGFALSLATVLAVPVSGGLPMLLTREVAGYARKENWSAYRGLAMVAYRWVLLACVAIGLASLTWKTMFGGMTDQQLLIIFLLVPFLGLNAIRNGLLKGLGRPVLAEAPSQVMQPALMILGYLTLAWLGLASATHALWWYLTVVVVVLVAASIMLWRVQPAAARGAARDTSDLPRWRRAFLPFAMISAATVLSTQVAVLLLGFAGMDEAVAQLRVAERGAQLVVFPLHAVNTVVGPYFVRAIKSGDKSELRRVARDSVRFALIAALLVGLILIAFGRSLIGWTFGTPYDEQAYLPMAILIAAQTLMITLGSGGIMLIMSGREKISLVGQVLSMALTVAICGALIGRLGAVGAATGAGFGIVASSLFFYFSARRHLGVSPGLV